MKCVDINCPNQEKATQLDIILDGPHVGICNVEVNRILRKRHRLLKEKLEQQTRIAKEHIQFNGGFIGNKDEHVIEVIKQILTAKEEEEMDEDD